MKIKIFTVPNIITCLNLFCGCLSIASAVEGNFLWAFIFIIIAAVFDFFDGFAARLLKSYSEIGKELDSLADMVSFGVAPSFILFALLESNGVGDIWRYGVFMVAVFSGLRLAKFNVDSRQSTDFIGLPTPANAILISSVVYIDKMGQYEWLSNLGTMVWAVVGFGVVLSFLLVSEIPMFSLKFKNFSLKENKLKYGFIIYTALIVLFLGLNAIPLMIVSYILVSVVRNFLLPLQRKNKE